MRLRTPGSQYNYDFRDPSIRMGTSLALVRDNKIVLSACMIQGFLLLLQLPMAASISAHKKEGSEVYF